MPFLEPYNNITFVPATTKQCSDNEFMCPSTYDDAVEICVPYAIKCDGHDHCGDGSDEQNCAGTLSLALSLSLWLFLSLALSLFPPEKPQCLFRNMFIPPTFKEAGRNIALGLKIRQFVSHAFFVHSITFEPLGFRNVI